MHFPVSGVYVSPLIPPLVAFIIAAVCSTCGVSGVFLLVPFQMSVLGFTSPAVSSTSQLYNIIGLPGGVLRYIKDGRMAWNLFWVMAVSSLPGMFVGSWIRIRYLTNPQYFKIFIGLILLYPGLRLVSEATSRYKKRKAEVEKLEQESVVLAQRAVENTAECVAACLEETKNGPARSSSCRLPVSTAIKSRRVTSSKIEYEFMEETFSFSTVAVVIMSVLVGVISGIYGIGGSVFTASFLVTILGLPIYTVAGATLGCAFICSVAGVMFYMILGTGGANVSPDWLLGTLLGIGGFAGNYFGAYMQRYLPDRLVRGTMGSLITFLAVFYVSQITKLLVNPHLQALHYIGLW